MDRKDIGSGVIGAILSALLVVTLLPAMGIQFAFADEPVPDAEASNDEAASTTAKERPEVTGGTLTLTGPAAEAAVGGEAATSAAAVTSSTGVADADIEVPVAHEREDGMLVAGGLVYTVADGGLALVGFDATGAAAQDAAPEDAVAADAEAVSDAVGQAVVLGSKLMVPARVIVDGKVVPVVAVDIADGQVADAVTVLALPQGIKDIKIERLASAFPHLASVEVASAASLSLPVAAGAASIRAAYSSSGGMLFRSTTVEAQAVGSHRADLASATGTEADVNTETVECKELVWAPPALLAARIPVECRSIAEGAFSGVRDLQTVVCFSTMERIAEGAFTDAQKASTKIVIPSESAAVAGEGAQRVSASMALMQDAGQGERRRTWWHDAGFPTENIVMGKPYGALTETLAVAPEGSVERTEAQLVSYPGMHARATDVKHPDEDGKIDMADNGLAFTVNSDMTASVFWKGDPTATPSHIDIPASVVIDDVTYPVTEIAPNAFKGAVFLTSVTIPEGVVAIGSSAFADCVNLTEVKIPTTLRQAAPSAFENEDGPLAPAANAEVASAIEDDAPDVPQEPEMQSGTHVSEEQLASGDIGEASMVSADISDNSGGAVADSEGVIGSYGASERMTQPLTIFIAASLPPYFNGDATNPLSVKAPGGWTVTNDFGAQYNTFTLTCTDARADFIAFDEVYEFDYSAYVQQFRYGRAGGAGGSATLSISPASGYVLTSASINYEGNATYMSDGTADERAHNPVILIGVAPEGILSADEHVTKAQADAAYAPKEDFWSMYSELNMGQADNVMNLTNSNTERITALEKIDHLKLGTTSTTAAAGNHTHSQYLTNTTAANTYATKSSLSSYVTTTALNSKGYITKTTADSTYALKSDMPDMSSYVTTTALSAKLGDLGTGTVKQLLDGKASTSHTHSNYLTNTTAASTYATKTDVSALQTTVGNSTSGLVKKVADLEAKPHLTIGTTSTTAAAGNHTHSQYATTASLSNYVTKTTADSTYAKKTDVPDLDGYVTKDAADAAYQPKGSYAASSHTHSQYATTTALNAKANANLLNTSSETAFTTTSTVRGAINGLSSRITTLEGKTHLTLGTTSTTAAAGNHTHSNYLTNTTAASTYATKTDVSALQTTVGNSTSGLVKKVADLEAKPHLTIGTTSTTAAAGNHTHSQYLTSATASSTYATKSSLSSYVTTTALNSKGYITQTDADSRYLLKDDVPSTEGYITKTEADAAYQPKGSYASSSHTHDSRYYTESEMDSKLLAKANANVLSKSGETAFSSTSTVRGTTDALSSRISTLEGKTHLELGTTSTTAAAGNHTHSQYATTASLSNYVTNATASSTYATKTSLSSYVTTTALDSKGYITKTDADATYAKKSDIPTGGDAPDLSGYATQEWVEGKGYLTTTDGDKRYLLKDDVPSTEGYITKDEADAAYQPKGDYAAKDHEHTQYAKTEALSNYVTNKTASDTYLSKTDAAKTYATVASLSGYVTTAALSGKLGDIGETTVAALLAGKVDASEFGTIRYVGLDEGDQNAYPTSYRKGSVPAVHAPVRVGYAFTGWTWKRGEATGVGELAQAFAEAGDVELTASWKEAPETPGGTDAPAGKHFFSGGVPLTAGDTAEYQEHVVKVRLSSTPKAVSRVEFEPNDKTGLLKDASDVRFFVASSQDALAMGTEVGWGASTQAGWSCQLAQLDDNSYGLYVGIRVPTSAIDASKVTTSYVDGSYVASLVKMNYTFA